MTELTARNAAIDDPVAQNTETEHSKTGPLTTQCIVVLDFGSQYAQLIARRVREQHVYCRILRHDITADRLAELAPQGIILSGGPASVYEDAAPRCDPGLFQLGIPVLGICYGMQLACEALGGKVDNTPSREYGPATCHMTDPQSLFSRPARRNRCLDEPRRPDFVDQRRLSNRWPARPTCPFAAIKHRELPVFGMQFHPEVTHTRRWAVHCIKNFVRDVCGCRTNLETG